MSSPKIYPNKAARKRAYRQRRAMRRMSNRPLPPLPGRINRQMPRTRRGVGRTRVITGRGDYRDTFKSVGRSLGSQLGETAGEAVLSLIGLGDYKASPIQQNSILPRKNGIIDFGGQGPPAIMNGGNGTVIINHREFVGNIYATADTKFHFQKYGLNPANQAFFPWLSKVATNFQQWKLKGAIVHLKSMATSYAANLSLGTIFAGIQYNYYAPDPNNMRELANLDGSCTHKSSKDVYLPIECAPRLTSMDELYIDNPGVIKEGDLRFNYMGNIYVGCEGVKYTTAPAPGEEPPVLFQVWISYEVELMKPILSNTVGVFDTLKITSPGFVTMAGEEPIDTWGDLVSTSQTEISWALDATHGDHPQYLRVTLPSYEAAYSVSIVCHVNSATGGGTLQFGVLPNAFCSFVRTFPGAVPDTVDLFVVPGGSAPAVADRNCGSFCVISVPEDPLDSNIPYFDFYLLSTADGVIAGPLMILVSQVSLDL